MFLFNRRAQRWRRVGKPAGRNVSCAARCFFEAGPFSLRVIIATDASPQKTRARAGMVRCPMCQRGAASEVLIRLYQIAGCFVAAPTRRAAPARSGSARRVQLTFCKISLSRLRNRVSPRKKRSTTGLPVEMPRDGLQAGPRRASLDTHTRAPFRP